MSLGTEIALSHKTTVESASRTGKCDTGIAAAKVPEDDDCGALPIRGPTILSTSESSPGSESIHGLVPLPPRVLKHR